MSTRYPLIAWVAIAAAIPAFAAGRVAFPPWGVDFDFIDTSVAPGADFFTYANGSWIRTAVIPSDRQMAGVNLELNKGNEAKLAGIVSDLLAKPAGELSADERKLRDLYNAFEDTRRIEAAGLAPVRGDLDRIASLRTHLEVASFLGSPATQVGGPFAIGIEISERNPEAYVLAVYQSGLGMPDRDYYLLADKDSVAARAAYKKFIAEMLAIAGVTDGAHVNAVYRLEDRIARAHWSAAERRDAEKMFNPMSLSDLRRLAPGFPWHGFLAASGVTSRSPTGERTVVVREKSAFAKLAKIFAATPVDVWRDYLTVHYLHSLAAYLPKRVDDADFAFYGAVLDGQKEQLPRGLRGIHLLDSELGEALGQLYTARYFPPEAKAKIRQLVDNLLRAYESDIGTLAWMGPATRAEALQKIHHLTVKVGYPDRWRDYSALQIVPDELVPDVTRARVFEWHRELQRIDGPVDRGEWDMTPPTNNAYYNGVLNEIVFPAGTLQPPFFDPNADDAVNYGEIGATIGHEISHGFDDQGSKYDATGRLRNWWTANDRREYEARIAALAKQYDAYQPLPDLHINGKLTLGENIADLTGLVIAHKAYRLSLRGVEAPVLDGLSGDQRFYLAYGQSWREIWTDGLTRRIALSDPHSPSAFRVNGVVRNDDGWYAAFPQINAGDRYYLAPAQRVRLW